MRRHLDRRVPPPGLGLVFSALAIGLAAVALAASDPAAPAATSPTSAPAVAGTAGAGTAGATSESPPEPGSTPAAPGVIESLLPDDPLSGGRLFVEKGCAKCHAVYGQGGTEGPDLGKTRIDRGFLEVAGVMWNHSPRMEEAFGRLRFARPTFTDEEMAKIIAFVYFLNYFDSPGNADRGRQLFAEKGCQRCHAVGGVGGKEGITLDGYSRFASPVSISTGMWNHGREMGDRMRRLGVPRPSFEAGDIRDILAYIRSAAMRGPDQSLIFLPPGNPRNGSVLFREKGCTNCHAIRGSGWSAGPDLGHAGMRSSLSTIAGMQWNHGPAMWEMMAKRGMAVPQFTEREMSDVVTYLYFIQYLENTGDVAAGRSLFIEKGCSTCHAVTPGGESAGPPVNRMEAFTSPTAVIAAMWNHASEMERMTWEKNVVWPTVEGREMANLVAFLLSAAPAKPDTTAP